MTTTSKISAYKVYWIEIKPTTGKITKHDRKAFGDLQDFDHYRIGEPFYKVFCSKDSANNIPYNKTSII